MRRLAKNLILATAVVSAIFFVDCSLAEAAHHRTYHAEKICPLCADDMVYIDFWSKFRDTVMPDEPQNNNPPKEKEQPPKSTPKPKPPAKPDKNS